MPSHMGRHRQMDQVMTEDTRVLYNETCPVCRFEIDGYRRRAIKDGLPIRFEPIDSAESWGLSQDDAARRLHVWHDGKLHSGIAAFRVLWAQMPRWRWLARLVGLPVVAQASEWLYEHVLAAWLYRAHLRRQSRVKQVD